MIEVLHLPQLLERLIRRLQLHGRKGNGPLQVLHHMCFKPLLQRCVAGMAPLCDAVEERGAVRQRFVHGVVQHIRDVWREKIVVEQEQMRGQVGVLQQNLLAASHILRGLNHPERQLLSCSSRMRMQRQAAGGQVARDSVDEVEYRDEVGRGVFGVEECA